MPHFYAIAWMYKDDYRGAGLRMVSTDDPTGARTGIHAVVSALILLPVSLLPALIGHSGLFYAVVAGFSRSSSSPRRFVSRAGRTVPAPAPYFWCRSFICR